MFTVCSLYVHCMFTALNIYKSKSGSRSIIRNKSNFEIEDVAIASWLVKRFSFLFLLGRGGGGGGGGEEEFPMETRYTCALWVISKLTNFHIFARVIG